MARARKGIRASLRGNDDSILAGVQAVGRLLRVITKESRGNCLGSRLGARRTPNCSVGYERSIETGARLTFRSGRQIGQRAGNLGVESCRGDIEEIRVLNREREQGVGNRAVRDELSILDVMQVNAAA